MEKPLDLSLRSLATREEAEALSNVLAENGIVSKITKDSGDLDYVFLGETPTNKYEVHINEEDKQGAERILKDLAKEDIEDVEEDYYLFSFTDDELKDVLIKHNEWNEFDVLLSQEILEKRGVEIDFNIIDKQRLIRDLELQEPEKGQVGWIIVGYVSVLFGGLFGILLGYSLWSSNKKLPNGTKVPVYTNEIRTHGRIMFYFGILWFVTVITYIFLSISSRH